MIGSEPAQLIQTHSHLGVHRECSLSLSSSVVTIGAFDGVHRGHQALLTQVVDEAHRRGVPSVVYTFETPPKSVFGTAVQLTPPEERIRRLSLFGIDHIVMARFDKSYAARTPESFIQELGRLCPQTLWVGGDFRFGKARVGDTALLGKYFQLRILEDVAALNGERISSTTIRALLKAGRKYEARLLHGWPEVGCLPGTVL